MELKKRLAESQEVNSRRLGDVEIRVTSLADQLSRSSESSAVQMQEVSQYVHCVDGMHWRECVPSSCNRN